MGSLVSSSSLYPSLPIVSIWWAEGSQQNTWQVQLPHPGCEYYVYIMSPHLVWMLWCFMVPYTSSGCDLPEWDIGRSMVTETSVSVNWGPGCLGSSRILFSPRVCFYSKLGEMILIGLLFLWCSSGVWWYSQQSSGPYFTFPSNVCPGGKPGGIGFLYRVIHVWCNYGLCGCSFLSSRLYNIFPKVVSLQQPQGNGLL